MEVWRYIHRLFYELGFFAEAKQIKCKKSAKNSSNSFFQPEVAHNSWGISKVSRANIVYQWSTFSLARMGHQIKHTKWKILKYWWLPFFLLGKSFPARGQMAGKKEGILLLGGNFWRLHTARNELFALPFSPLLLLQQFAFFPVEGLF